MTILSKMALTIGLGAVSVGEATKWEYATLSVIRNLADSRTVSYMWSEPTVRESIFESSLDTVMMKAFGRIKSLDNIFWFVNIAGEYNWELVSITSEAVDMYEKPIDEKTYFFKRPK